jgi:uncharacterized protein with NAD-binding domain and iron-sulfur cluster
MTKESTHSYLPPFIYSPGQSTYKAPFKHDNCHIYGFFIEGKLVNIQNTINESLNKAAQGQKYYKALSSLVMLQFAKLNEVYSLAPGFRDMGKIVETDVITWVLVGEFDSDESFCDAYWYPVYMWVDDSQAVSTGREVYGYPKQLGKMQMPRASEETLSFSLDVHSHSDFGFEEYSKTTRLLSIQSTANEQAKTCSKAEIAKRILTLLMKTNESPKLSVINNKSLIRSFLDTDVKQIFLKQFPDTAGNRAIYQSVVSTRSVFNNTYSTKYFPRNKFKLDLKRHDTTPFLRTLGIKPGSVDIKFAYYQHSDFTTQKGVEHTKIQSNVKEKIVVIGGGIAAMSSVFHLTEQPNWREKYDITIYQIGWRLGGKGASGRNKKYGHRIEEHGLHIWFGCYHNSFSMIKTTYDRLKRDNTHPMQNWHDAFKPHNLVGLAENLQKGQSIAYTRYPSAMGEPGDGKNEISMQKALLTSLGYIERAFFEFLILSGKETNSNTMKLTKLLVGIAQKLDIPKSRILPNFQELVLGLSSILSNFSVNSSHQNDSKFRKVKSLLIQIKQKMTENLDSLLSSRQELRQLYISIDIATTIIIGIIDDKILEFGFDSINNIEFMQWLEKHGANKKYSINSAYIRSLYDLAFAYRNGEYNRPDLEAGTITRALLRMTECYNGAFMYKMQGGMGDVVFEPMYKLLKQRGVKFEFFSQVDEIKSKENSVSEITIKSQVTLKPNFPDYNPFIKIDSMDCWPSEPNYEQLKHSDFIKNNYSLLEIDPNKWGTTWLKHTGEELPTKRLKIGRDFDRVILATSLASIPSIASELVNSDIGLQKMLKNIKTNATQAFQLWSDIDIKRLGWTIDSAEEPIVSGFVKPFDTWAPMSHLAKFEKWPDFEPKTISYHCSTLPDSLYRNHNEAEEVVKVGTSEFLKKYMCQLLPDFDSDLDNNKNPKTLYSRANTNGSERYVTSHVGTTKYRLGADQTRFNNLYLAGDWTKNGVNLGCIEAAVNSGMMASRAICGQPNLIEGEFDF